MVSCVQKNANHVENLHAHINDRLFIDPDGSVAKVHDACSDTDYEATDVTLRMPWSGHVVLL